MAQTRFEILKSWSLQCMTELEGDGIMQLDLPPPCHLQFGFQAGFFTSGSYHNQMFITEFNQPSDIFQA